MNLDTTYMGLELSCPLIVGASPLCESLDAARRAEDAGAGALVMRSLFEEQLRRDQLAMIHHTEVHAYSHAEALDYFPEPDSFGLGPDAYLEQLRRLHESLDIPVIASLNGVTDGGWVEYARVLEEAGAHGLELNIYYLAFDPEEDPRAVEDRYVRVLEGVKAEVSIPVAVKLGPFFSAPIHMARRLVSAGADALVIFNRFYQPDIDIEALEMTHRLELSDSHTLLMRLRWLAAMHGRVAADLCVTGGVHDAQDAIKALMAGATGVQMASALLRHGPEHLGTVREELTTFLVEREYDSLQQMVGSMSLLRCPDPRALERANYMQILDSWHLG